MVSKKVTLTYFNHKGLNILQENGDLIKGLAIGVTIGVLLVIAVVIIYKRFVHVYASAFS